MKINYAIVFVSDMKQSVGFYKNILGLPLKFETTHWTEFATEGVTLALHKSDVINSVKDDPKMEPPGRCRTGFSVPNLNEFHKRMLEYGVECIQDPKEVFGAMIAQYLDPDGMVLGVSEESRGK
jgi:catechol 2,3-dioxygenase-like lactoylglutathione lyase family enzyme